MRVGDLRLTALNDGICKLPQQFYVGLDFEAHPELLADDGLIHIPIGCYVIRTGDRTVLIDAGLGVLDVGWARGGDLPAALEAAGVRREDIDLVVATHLHLDHIGWLAVDGEPWFPNATVRYGAADWDRFVSEVGAGDRTRVTMEAYWPPIASIRWKATRSPSHRELPRATPQDTRSATTGSSCPPATNARCCSEMPSSAPCR